MTAPTQQEAMQMARECGISIRHEDECDVTTFNEVIALVAAAYARGVEDAKAQAAIQVRKAICDCDLSHAAIRNRSKT